MLKNLLLLSVLYLLTRLMTAVVELGVIEVVVAELVVLAYAVVGLLVALAELD